MLLEQPRKLKLRRSDQEELTRRLQKYLDWKAMEHVRDHTMFMRIVLGQIEQQQEGAE